MLMEVLSVDSEIDPRTGYSIEHVQLADSEFESVTIKRTSEDEMKITATEDDGYEWNYMVELEKRAAQVVRSRKPRREIEDDIQDALLSAGFTIIGEDLNI